MLLDLLYMHFGKKKFTIWIKSNSEHLTDAIDFIFSVVISESSAENLKDIKMSFCGQFFATTCAVCTVHAQVYSIVLQKWLKLIKGP